MRERKPRAYLRKEICGLFMFEPLANWIARDRYGNYIARGRTRKECEKECRDYGYVPERYE